MRRRTILLASASTMLGACATRGSVADGTTVRPTQGLLAFGIESNTAGTLDYTDLALLSESSAPGAGLSRRPLGGAFAIAQGSAHFVLPLDPSEYTWSQFTVGSFVPMRFNLRRSRFVVKPGAITYVGHVGTYLSDRLLRTTVHDRESDMRAHLQEKFPVYLRTMAFEKALAVLRT